jgi:hypothetical protein
MTIQPFDGTVSRRRGYRQDVRNALGVSHDGPPSLRQIASAVAHLNNLIKLSTAGEYRLRVERKDGSLVDGGLWAEWKEGDR